MQERVWTVEEYLKTAPVEHRVVLRQLWVFCRVLLPDHEESLRYRMPTYSKSGSADIAFASQPHGIFFYVLKRDVAARYRAELSDVEASCLHYAKPEDVDFGLVERLLQATAAPPLF